MFLSKSPPPPESACFCYVCLSTVTVHGLSFVTPLFLRRGSQSSTYIGGEAPVPLGHLITNEMWLGPIDETSSYLRLLLPVPFCKWSIDWGI